MSTPSTTPFFGRAYQLSITLQSGDTIYVSQDSWEPQALRFTFSITQQAFKAFWFADIEIFNCDGPITSGPSAGQNLAQTVIYEGDVVTIKAGYQAAGEPQIIWQGKVFQSIWERLDVVDYKLTLHCIVGRNYATQNLINNRVAALSTQREQAAFIAENSVNNIPIQSPLTLLSEKALPRAKSFFGCPHDYLHNLADDNGMLSWLTDDGFNMDTLAAPAGAVVGSYAPCSPLNGPPVKQPDGTILSLIGTPQQTQYGVDFKVLLDSNLRIKQPLPQVMLQEQYIRQARVVYQQLPPRPLVEQYVVVGVRHVGDTRGNPWYSEVTALSCVLDVITLLGSPVSN